MHNFWIVVILIFEMKWNQISHVPKMTCKPFVLEQMMLNICICSFDKILISKESPTSCIQWFGSIRPICDPTHVMSILILIDKFCHFSKGCFSKSLLYIWFFFSSSYKFLFPYSDMRFCKQLWVFTITRTKHSW
jgi:hypothetical protein